jgi:DNA-binding GntR family transcriptional regulator
MLAEPLATAAPETAAQRAYAALRVRILEGALPPGAMILEGELAAALGVSRTPVRQALIRLADEGLIELRPRHGMRVRPISADEMREIYDVLTALEAAAARLCAEQGVPPAGLDGLDQAVAAMDAALAAGDLRGWAEADAAFHRRLVAASGNRRLAATVSGFSDLAHRARMATLRLRPVPSASNQDHRAVVAAIRARDPGRAEAIHRAHRQQAGDLLARLLADLPSGGA